MLSKEIKKELKDFKNKLLKEETQKNMVLNHKMDWAFLETLIQRANENPNLNVEVLLADGTRLTLKTIDEKHGYVDKINGLD